MTTAQLLAFMHHVLDHARHRLEQRRPVVPVALLLSPERLSIVPLSTATDDDLLRSRRTVLREARVAEARAAVFVLEAATAPRSGLLADQDRPSARIDAGRALVVVGGRPGDSLVLLQPFRPRNSAKPLFDPPTTRRGVRSFWLEGMFPRPAPPETAGAT